MDKLSKFKEIVDVLDKDVPSTREVAELVAQIIAVVKESKRLLEQQAEQNKQDLSNLVNSAYRITVEELNALVSKAERDFGIKADKLTRESIKEIKDKSKTELDELTTNLFLELKKVANKIPDLAPLYGKIEELAKKIVPQKEVLGEEIVDKINKLPIEPEFQIEKEHIKGLVEELSRIASLPRGGGASRRVFIPYRDDFSSLTDGSTKTFYLSRAPLSEATIMVYGTDFPVILRPTIDFTVANKALTLTTAVPAPNSGATLIVTYFA